MAESRVTETASLRFIVSLGRVIGTGRADDDVMSADGSSEGADT